MADDHLTPEVQTDKDANKVVPCTVCGRDLVVNLYYAPAKALCSSCREAGGAEGVASVAAVVPGQTDPAKATNLVKCLVNPGFAHALCPVHPDDEEHEMELKWVSHSERYGPMELVGYKAGGVPEFRQLGPGETVMWQCLKCKATSVYSTTAQVQFRRQNEPVPGKHVSPQWAEDLGAREEPEELAS